MVVGRRSQKEGNTTNLPKYQVNVKEGNMELPEGDLPPGMYSALQSALDYLYVMEPYSDLFWTRINWLQGVWAVILRSKYYEWAWAVDEEITRLLTRGRDGKKPIT